MIDGVSFAVQNGLEGQFSAFSEERAIDAFTNEVRRRELKEELGRKRPKTIVRLMEIANSWADGEDAVSNTRRRSDDEDERRFDHGRSKS